MSNTTPIRFYIPRLILSLFVRDFWLYENYDGSHQRELIVSSGARRFSRRDSLRSLLAIVHERWRGGKVIVRRFASSPVARTVRYEG
jgi:hypothetical protein